MERVKIVESKRKRTRANSNLLGRKRESALLSDNFIFRPSIDGVIKNEYEKVAHNFKNMFAFNWEDEKIVKEKLRPGKNNELNINRTFSTVLIK